MVPRSLDGAPRSRLTGLTGKGTSFTWSAGPSETVPISFRTLSPSGPQTSAGIQESGSRPNA